jgi:hypothetical protein
MDIKYDRVLIFTKKGNLMDYLNTDKVSRSLSLASSSHIKEHYEREREIQLVAQLRWEERPAASRNRTRNPSILYCSIKCPVNPLPVKGEFQLASLEALRKFLKADGWELKQDISSGWFK